MIRGATEELPSVDVHTSRALVERMRVVWGAGAAVAAGLGVASLARSLFLEGDPQGREVVMLPGPGWHGEIAEAAARWLRSWGARVHEGVAAFGEGLDLSLVIDGSSESPVDAVSMAADQAEAPVLAIGWPSGLDPVAGQVRDATARGTATVCFGLAIHALLDPELADHVGDVYIADPGLLPEDWEALGVVLETGAPFAITGLVRAR